MRQDIDKLVLAGVPWPFKLRHKPALVLSRSPFDVLGLQRYEDFGGEQGDSHEKAVDES